jgi:hypothetical protein
VPPTPTGRGNVVEPFDVPHRLQPNALKEILEKEYSQRLQKDHPALAQPSKNPDSSLAFTAEVSATAAKAKDSILRMTCAKCHDGAPEKIASPSIPPVWMHSAKFDHAAHRATACLDCHPKAVSEIKNNFTVVNEREPVNIRGLESCRECHAPKSGDRGGIRHGCTDCHSYHGGDQPHGRNAFAPKPLKIEEFLKGQ